MKLIFCQHQIQRFIYSNAVFPVAIYIYLFVSVNIGQISANNKTTLWILTLIQVVGYMCLLFFLPFTISVLYMVAVKLIVFHDYFADNIKMGPCHIIVRKGQRLYSEPCISFRI